MNGKDYIIIALFIMGLFQLGLFQSSRVNERQYEQLVTKKNKEVTRTKARVEALKIEGKEKDEIIDVLILQNEEMIKGYDSLIMSYEQNDKLHQAINRNVADDSLFSYFSRYQTYYNARARTMERDTSRFRTGQD